MYAARLEDDGIPVDVHLYEGMLHGFINHPYPPTFDAVEKIIRFVG
jgi:acetyl esterase/lipase